MKIAITQVEFKEMIVLIYVTILLALFEHFTSNVIFTRSYINRNSSIRLNVYNYSTIIVFYNLD